MNTRYITLGTFVLVTLGAFGWLAFQLGLGDRGGTHYTVRTRDAAGLVEGNQVRIAGVDVGKVARIHVEGNEAVIDLRIRKDTTVFADACAAVHIKGMLGEKYLGIEQGAAGTPLAAGATFQCVKRTVDFDNALNATTEIVYGEESLLPVMTRIAKRIDNSTAFMDTPAAAAPTAPAEPGAAAPVGGLPPSLTKLSGLLDTTDDLLKTSLGILTDNREDLRAIVKGTRALVEDPRIPRMLANGDKTLALVNNRLPGMLNDLETLIARGNEALEVVSGKNRARLDKILADASAATDNLRAITEEFKGLGTQLSPSLKHIGPLLADLRTIVHRATYITETSIRQMLQMEGFRVRLGQGREARQHMRESQTGDSNPQP